MRPSLTVEHLLEQFTNEDTIQQLKDIFHKNYLTEKSLNIDHNRPIKYLFKAGRTYEDVIEIKLKMKYSKSHIERISHSFNLNGLHKKAVKSVLNEAIYKVEDFAGKRHDLFKQHIESYNEELQKLKEKYHGV